ncbi:hypothetical protein P389DRAFT_168425 [Cystobasidium minutum MCA 4210]|uniref:uncharacterized protein n=1 Tax=Cystobasidium minutum MCA 4210 TaxID=1397322 RepID=UPI0034CF2169|eukprot:jgi/Rhomi1/168425/fgenesh1_kg.2_\
MSSSSTNNQRAAASDIISGPAATAMKEHHEAQAAKPGFVDQVKGYAKEFAGKSFGKEHEQAQGQAIREGQVRPEDAKSAITKESVQSGNPGSASSFSSDNL